MTLYGRAIDQCIKCSICVEHCPVYRVDPAFPGPKQSGPDSQRFRHDRETRNESWLASCSHCTLCETACPSGVPIAAIILREQTRQIESEGKKPVHHLLSSPSLLGKLAMISPWMVNQIVGLTMTRRFMEKIFGIDRNLPFPEYKRLSFGKAKAEAVTEVLYFNGCTVRYNQPELALTIEQLYQQLNIRVIVPKQDCCGLPKLCNGDRESAARHARKQIREFSRGPYKDLPIIYNCTSCGHTLANEWAELEEDKELFESFSNRLYDVHEFVAEYLQTHAEKLSFKSRPLRLAYHIPCHLRSLGIGLPGVNMLRQVPDLDIHVLTTGCCGLSGTYGYKPGHGEISRKIGGEVAQAIERIRPDFVVTDCGSCRLQLHALTGLPVKDPLEILSSSLFL